MSIISGIGWSTINQISKQVINIIASIILMRLLTPDDFGLIAMIAVVTGFSSILLDFGLGVSIIQNQNLDDKSYSSIFWVNCFLGFLLAVFVYLSGPLLAKFYNEPLLKELTTILSFNYILASTFLVHRSLLIKKLSFKKIAQVEISTILFANLIGIGFAWYGAGVFSIVYKDVGAMLLMALFFFVVSDWRPKLFFSINEIKKVFGLSSSMFFNSIYSYAINNTEKVLIGKIYGKGELGAYSSMLNYTMLPVKSVARIFSFVLMPSYAQIQNDKERIGATHLKLLKITSIIFFPVFLIISLNASFLVMTILGEQWILAVPYVQLFAIMSGAVLLNSFIGSVLQGVGRNDLIIKDALFKRTVVLVAVLIGSIWGVLYIAIGRFISEVVNLQYSFLQAEKAVGLSYYQQFNNLTRLLSCFIPSLVGHYFLFQMDIGGGKQFLLSVVIITTTYILSLYLAERESLVEIKSLTKKILNR